VGSGQRGCRLRLGKFGSLSDPKDRQPSRSHLPLRKAERKGGPAEMSGALVYLVEPSGLLLCFKFATGNVASELTQIFALRRLTFTKLLLAKSVGVSAIGSDFTAIGLARSNLCGRTAATCLSVTPVASVALARGVVTFFGAVVDASNFRQVLATGTSDTRNTISACNCSSRTFLGTGANLTARNTTVVGDAARGGFPGANVWVP
jgi:hypothetical protein